MGGEDNCGLLIVSINRSLTEPFLCPFTQILLTLQCSFQTDEKRMVLLKYIYNNYTVIIINLRTF